MRRRALAFQMADLSIAGRIHCSLGRSNRNLARASNARLQPDHVDGVSDHLLLDPTGRNGSQSQTCLVGCAAITARMLPSHPTCVIADKERHHAGGIGWRAKTFERR